MANQNQKPKTKNLIFKYVVVPDSSPELANELLKLLGEGYQMYNISATMTGIHYILVKEGKINTLNQ